MASNSSSSGLLDQLKATGYVIIPSILSPEDLQKLRAAAEESVTLARKGGWPHIRTLPKQFPPWSSDPSSGIWGVQHLLHPDQPSSALFARTYFCDAIMNPAKELLQCTDDELVMELYNMLVTPDDDFALRWHRDDVPATATTAEEEERLNHPAHHAQWNLALYEDRSLIVVPGSHARARTQAERDADPFEDNMPGQLIVTLQPGDVIFYNNNIFHRGVYKKDVKRATLHGSVGHIAAGTTRARNVLQHSLRDWVEKSDFSLLDPKERTRAEAMRQRLVSMGREAGDVGYAHDD